MDHLFVDSVIKSFGPVTVLTDIFLSCKAGEVVGLIGRNGSGKSTLMKIIFGSLNAQQKFVRINGVHISSMKQSIKSIKYLPQGHYLPENMRIEKVINIYEKIIDLEKFKSNPLVSPLIQTNPKRLSAGERRIVEILILLHAKSQYILLDEPFNGVAPIYKEEIKAVIRDVSKTKGIIVTDHDHRNVIDISDRLILLYNGSLKRIEDKDELAYYGYFPQ